MLSKALHYFWTVFLYDVSRMVGWPGNRPHSISGGDYWQYRIAVERLLFSMLCAFFVVNALMPKYIETPSTAWMWATITAALGILESIRLHRKLKGQLEFEELFYG